MRFFLYLFASFYAFSVSKRTSAPGFEDYEISSVYIYELYDMLLQDFQYYDHLTETVLL